MKKGLFSVAALLMATGLYTGCYYDKESIVYPSGGSNCDTTGITLSGDINSILSANCFSCHGGNAALGGGIQLDQYAVLKAYAQSGTLLSSIKQDGGAQPMPQGGGKLSACEISKFEAWINSGTPNN